MRNKYILLRHGETIYQAKKLSILYSKKEQFTLSITENGKKRIKEVTKELKDKKIDLIYSSDYLRTKQTAEIIAKGLGLKIKLDKRLRDKDFGIFSGRRNSEHRKIYSSMKQRFRKRPKKGENWRDVRKRMADFIKQIDKKHKNKTILIVSHQDPIGLLAGFLKGLNEKELLEKKNLKELWLDVGQFLEP